MAGPHNYKQAIENKIYTRALKDETFRQAFLTDPKATLAKEFGLRVPEYVNLHVNENTPTDIHLTIPSKPDSEQLTEAMLTGTSDAWHVCICTSCGEYTSFEPGCTPDC